MLAGDGYTDDYGGLQGLLVAQAGRDVVLDKTRGPFEADYFCSQPLRLHGYGQTLRGAFGGGQAGVRIRFPENTPGLILTNDTVQGGCVRDLVLEAPDRWDSAYPEQAVFTGTADGIKLGATNCQIKNTTIVGFSRHAINVGDGQGTGFQADSFYLANLYLANCRGNGLHIEGGDSSAGTTVQVRVVGNQGWGIADLSNAGNTHISPLADANHWDNTPDRAATAVWKAAGFRGGAYHSAGPVGNLWLKPYAEGDQPGCDFNPRDVVVCPALGSGWNEDAAPGFVATQMRGVNGFHLPPFVSSNGTDLQLNLEYRAGRNSAQNVFQRFTGPTGRTMWAVVAGDQQGFQVWQGEPWQTGSECWFWVDGRNRKMYLGGHDIEARLRAIEVALGAKR